MGSIQNLPAWDADARLRVVVETPKGSGAKLRYDAMSGTFIYQRPLPNLVIHEAATWPGIVIPCLPIALLKIVDKKHDETSARQNHRLIAVPAATPAMEPALSDLQRVELEGFFRVVGQQLKEVTIVGWGDAEEARTEITRTIVNEQGARA
jgi:inorganic pyrophosphatase